jgi:N-acyl-phosphatidylethanolamine-hydrolysing phospholipase D
MGDVRVRWCEIMPDKPRHDRSDRTRSRLSRRALNRVLGLLPFALAGCAADSVGEDAARPWHHGPDGFRNPPGSPPRGGDFGDWFRFFTRNLGGRPSIEVPEGHVLDPAEVEAGLTAHNPIDALTWLGHASFLIQIDGRRILTDPYLTDYASPVAPLGPKRFAGPGLAPDRLPRVDVLLLSHNHYDHMDLTAIEALAGKDHIQVVVPLGLGHYFTERGYSHVQEMDWHDRMEVADLQIQALPAIHFSKRTLFDRNQTLWTGYAIQGREHRIYFAGDTGFGPVFRELGQGLAPFDVALLPIGAYEPRLLMRAVHATPEEAVQIGRELRARRLVGMHWGTISLTEEPPFEPPERFRAAARAAGYAKADSWVMSIGETRAI